MTDKKLQELKDWITVNVFGWEPCVEKEYPHRDGYLRGDEFCLEHDMKDWPTDAAAAMAVLEYCMRHLDRLTGRTDFQIVVLYDEGSVEPYSVMTDSTKDADDMTHVRNCATAKTIEAAICLFAKNLFTK